MNTINETTSIGIQSSDGQRSGMGKWCWEEYKASLQNWGGAQQGGNDKEFHVLMYFNLNITLEHCFLLL